MAHRTILASLALACLTAGCISPMQEYHGYAPDEVAPNQITPGIDTRSSVLAQLGSPSTRSIFDDNTWMYITTIQERFAFYRPDISTRTVTAIRFSDEDVVEEVLEYDQNDGRVLNYASRETPTRGRELGLWEQIFGNVGRSVLPPTNEATPGNPTGRRN
ncbi:MULTISPECIES: outer membrane protein assembly factor BamE [Henriciella]|jgi:outer membrane protein assembly factor BamE (lipoprotein component of BamABCDE complex)|uniref:Outer membrane protein assembly factor BamE n=1 Tax=Henriciella algicola TaxID=1608422 RepID=A0A399RBZ0_9PROT|nr:MULTISPECIES: outer membrane protein assembly factor BamE [Henriciella]RIJ28990.1 outer membrane protein assembly factor BamE [Henriciella algicola]HIG22065.1 outer membrane protein assembly factor BamE [Henriciella sp.]